MSSTIGQSQTTISHRRRFFPLKMFLYGLLLGILVMEAVR